MVTRKPRTREAAPPGRKTGASGMSLRRFRLTEEVPGPPIPGGACPPGPGERPTAGQARGGGGLQGMKILVTGSAGHLGEALVLTLRNARHEVVALDRRPSPFTTDVGSIT